MFFFLFKSVSGQCIGTPKSSSGDRAFLIRAKNPLPSAVPRLLSPPTHRKERCSKHIFLQKSLFFCVFKSIYTHSHIVSTMNRALGRLSNIAGLSAAGLGAVNFCLYNVDGGERAVMFDSLRNGILPHVINEGTHFYIPGIQRPQIIEIRTKPREIPSVTGTKDLQMVNIKLRVLWRPIVEELPTLYRELGTDFDDRVLPSIGNEVLKSVVAQYNAEELLSKRAEVSARIKQGLTERAKHFHLTLDDVAITHLTFGKEFMRAIEAKQVASQEAERQQWVVKKAEQERQAVVTRAEGESEAAAIITRAMEKTGNAIIEVRRIDAAKEIAAKLANSRNITYLPGGSGGGDHGGAHGGSSSPGLLLNIDK